ncbi:hypothetical protein TISLANDTSLP1_03180 [Thermodesulfovibrio yellowstonii]|jgi:hypothetical protein|uniref:Uncharacterized protein n=2 Tax=Thermodesulfovibrio yellowstonii TaxID=28262 RepID=B5YHB8_THEYD|nr:hypothetical protein THEYE_A0088 [Thermodesulfovibrio yellowstonii DSM 11347]GLI52625.1 hypothetical protein TISLANDTSLP1_03180 [Thermodesulfovibrio islandicus]
MKIIANIKNFFMIFIDDNNISIKLPFSISVRSIPNITKRIPSGMLRIKNSPKKLMNKNEKCINNN